MNTERMEKLERQVRRQQKLNWILGIIVMGAIGFGFTQADIDELALRRLAILDAAGNPRIVLSAADDLEGNAAAIRYFDEEMNERLRTGTEPGGVIASSFYDKEGEIRMGIGILDEAGVAISMYAEEREVMLELGYHYALNRVPALYLEQGKLIGPRQFLMYDSENEIRVAIEAEDEEGGSGLHFVDEDNVIRMSMGLGLNNACGISMFDETYALRWRATVQDETCGMDLYDSSGISRISQAVLDTKAAFLSINGEDEALEIVLGSVSDQVLFCVEGEEDGTLLTKNPVNEKESEEMTDEK